LGSTSITPENSSTGWPSFGEHFTEGRTLTSTGGNRQGQVKGLAAEFEQHGQEAIRRVRERDPSTFLKIISNILPKQFETTVNMNILVEFENARDFASAWEVVKRAKEMIGARELETIDLEAERRDSELSDD
jgi:hypothetical protein